MEYREPSTRDPYDDVPPELRRTPRPVPSRARRPPGYLIYTLVLGISFALVHGWLLAPFLAVGAEEDALPAHVRYLGQDRPLKRLSDRFFVTAKMPDGTEQVRVFSAPAGDLDPATVAASRRAFAWNDTLVPEGGLSEVRRRGLPFAIFGAMGLVAVAGGLYGLLRHARRRRLLAVGAVTVGEVVRRERRRKDKNGPPWWCFAIDYEASGQRCQIEDEACAGDLPTAPDVGDRVVVVYDPASPRRALFHSAIAAAPRPAQDAGWEPAPPTLG